MAADEAGIAAAEPARLLDEGRAAHRAGDFAKAEALYRQVLELAPDEPNALANLGALALQQGHLAEAVAIIDRALLVKPDQPGPWSNRGGALMSMGRMDEALASFERALALDPAQADAHSNRAFALKELGRLDEAEAAFGQAAAHRPGFVAALNGLGMVRETLGRFEAALEAFDAAIAVAPEVWGLHFNRGNALRALGRLEAAVEAYDRAAALEPRNPEIWCNRAVALQGLLRLDEAEAACARAIALSPEDVNAHWNRALIRLLKGDYPGGWADYEWRWRRAAFTEGGGPPPEGPKWLGELPLKGLRLLIVCEQGFGDTLQMLRYAKVAADQGAYVLAIVEPPLVELAHTVPGVSEVLTGGEPITYHVWTPVMSLPLAFGTTADTVPNGVPYVTAPDAHRAAWAQRLGPRARPRIGLAWSGRPTHANDANRSLTAAQLAPLLDVDADFVSLQPDYREADREVLARDGRIQDVSRDLKSFADTAGLIEALDLVVSVDTSVAHLAGAMGKPVRVLLPYAPDFRWGVGTNASPWYPTARLVRQPVRGDWASVIASLADELS